MVSKILKTEEAIANMSYEGAAEEYYRYGHGHILRQYDGGGRETRLHSAADES